MPARFNPLPSRLTAILVTIFLVVLLVHLAGVSALRYFVEKTLHPALPKGTYVGEVHLNLFTGTLEVDGFELKQAGRQRLRFGELKLEVSPWRLLTGQLHIKKAELTNAYARVERQPDGSFDLGLPPFGSETEAEEPTGELPAILLDGVAIRHLTLDYQDGELASLLKVLTLKVGAYSSRSEQQQIPISWDMRWDGKAIGGDAELAMGPDGVGATGAMQTGALALGRAQQLARLAPVATGQLAYRGPFKWAAPDLALSGLLESAELAYSAADQQVGLSGLRAEDFALDLQLEPKLTARLSLGKGLDVSRFAWKAAGQGVAASQLRTKAELFYENGAQLLAKGLDVTADTLAWESGARQARLSGVALSGQVTQTLTESPPLPLITAELSAKAVNFADSEADIALDLNALALGELVLAESDVAGDRDLQVKIKSGQSQVRQGASTVRWGAEQGMLSGQLPVTGDPQLAAEVTVSALSIDDPRLPKGPLELAQATVQGLRFDPDVLFQRLLLKGIDLPAASPETALKVAAVDLQQGRYSAKQGVSLGEIVIDGLQTGVIRDKSGVWRHVMSPAAKAASTPAAKPAQQVTKVDVGTPSESMAWSIGGLTVTGDSFIMAADYLNPDMTKPRFRIDRLNLGAISSRKPATDTPFAVTLRPDKYSEFVIDGKVRPLADQLALQAEGHLNGFGLSTVNGLVANDLGHRFVKGQLDNEFKITITKNRLDMGNGLRLSGVNVEEIQGKEGPPLGTAIALLEDRDGNIKLDVPVAGNLDDPEFRVLGALNPIIMKAVAGTAALAIQPLGSVLLVGSLLANQALKVTFEPALFDAGSTTPDAKAEKYLGQLAGKLKEKPKLAIRVCGIVVDAERKKDKKGAYLDTEEAVLAVAQQRADAARAILRAEGAVKKQLRNCRPSIDTKAEAKPRVDIKF